MKRKWKLNLNKSVRCWIMIGLVLMHFVVTSANLCEERCEQGTPYLRTLKIMWRRTQQRLGPGSAVSFEEFIQQLISASGRHSRLWALRDELISMISAYRDCVKACEHQHSKRSDKRSDRRRKYRSIQSTLCLLAGVCKT